MSTFHTRKISGESNADKLRDLLNGSSVSDQHNQSAVEYLKSKNIYGNDGIPALDDLVRLIQTVEHVNQQLLFENKFLVDEKNNMKAQNLRLIQDNGNLHKELKNCTVHEILADMQAGHQSMLLNGTDKNKDLEIRLKTKTEELQKSQILIDELQKKLLDSSNSKQPHYSTNNMKYNTLDSNDLTGMGGTKFNEEIEIKIRQIENLKIENEQLAKTKDFLRSKLDEHELKEADLIGQVKRYADLVRHIEQEKEQGCVEKEQYRQDKLLSEKKIEEFLKEFQENLIKEKQTIMDNVESQLEQNTEKMAELENRCFKQEALIDRLTRDKVSLQSEMEGYKTKCNTVDLEAFQMSEKLRNKYNEIVKERDLALYEAKRIRKDYDCYVKDTDQDLFCLRSELNLTRNRLTESNKDTEEVRKQCISLTEEVNQLKNELVVIKHSTDTIEISRKDNLKQVKEDYEARETQLAEGIEVLQTRYCITLKELEDLIELQKRHISKLKTECGTLTEQLEILAIKYKNDVSYFKDSSEELNVRLEKYKERTDELEEQSVKHNELHDRMKIRLKEMTLRIQEQNQQIESVKSSESLMQATNLQLMHEIETVKKQLSLYAVPTKFVSNEGSRAGSKFNSVIDLKGRGSMIPMNSFPTLVSSRTNNGVLETARSAIEESIFSIRSKLAV